MSNPNIGQLAKLANIARNDKLTPERRSQIASIAAKKRWADARKRANHTCTNMCKCSVCRRFKFKHQPNSEICQEFKCESL